MSTAEWNTISVLIIGNSKCKAKKVVGIQQSTEKAINVAGGIIYSWFFLCAISHKWELIPKTFSQSLSPIST